LALAIALLAQGCVKDRRGPRAGPMAGRGPVSPRGLSDSRRALTSASMSPFRHASHRRNSTTGMIQYLPDFVAGSRSRSPRSFATPVHQRGVDGDHRHASGSLAVRLGVSEPSKTFVPAMIGFTRPPRAKPREPGRWIRETVTPWPHRLFDLLQAAGQGGQVCAHDLPHDVVVHSISEGEPKVLVRMWPM